MNSLRWIEELDKLNQWNIQKKGKNSQKSEINNRINSPITRGVNYKFIKVNRRRTT